MCYADLFMAFVCRYERLSHLVKPGSYGLAEFLIDQLEYTVHAVDNIHFADFVNLFQGALLKFDDEFLVHRKDGDFEIRMGKFGYCSHILIDWIADDYPRNGGKVGDAKIRSYFGWAKGFAVLDSTIYVHHGFQLPKITIFPTNFIYLVLCYCFALALLVGIGFICCNYNRLLN